MSMVQGLIRSNSFKVKDVKAFKEWFSKNVWYGDNIKIWKDDESLVFGGYVDHADATPWKIEDSSGERWLTNDWELEDFAVEIRKHLADGEELRVIAISHDKLKSVWAEQIIIDETTCETEGFFEGY